LLSYLLSLIKACCLWRSQILSQYVSLFSFFTFLSFGDKTQERVSSGVNALLGLPCFHGDPHTVNGATPWGSPDWAWCRHTMARLRGT
jgi:hypothetical protein